MLISQLIGKPVISIYDGETVGTVIRVNINKRYKKLENLVIFNDDLDEDYAVNVNNIYSLNDVILIKNKDEINLSKAIETNLQTKVPFNCKVVMLDGSNRGKLVDIAIDENYNIVELYTEDDKYSVDNILNIGKDILLLSTTKTFLYKFKPNVTIIKNTKTEQEVTILKKAPYQIMDQNQFMQEDQQPKKISTSADFLIGRKLQSTILDDKGNIIVKKNAIINKEIIEKAISSNNYRLLLEKSFMGG